MSGVPLKAGAWLADGLDEVRPDGVHGMAADTQPQGQLHKVESRCHYSAQWAELKAILITAGWLGEPC